MVRRTLETWPIEFDFDSLKRGYICAVDLKECLVACIQVCASLEMLTPSLRSVLGLLFAR